MSTTTTPLAAPDLIDPYADSAARFRRESANHEMTVLRDDGLYRHLRFQNPESGFYWFDLVTWPGRLAFTGDVDGFMFARVEDMFTFFRRQSGYSYSINPQYWAEKVVDGRDRLKRYDQDILDAQLAEVLADYAKVYPDLATRYELDKADFDALPRSERYPSAPNGAREPVEPKSPADLQELVDDYNADGALAFESGARDLLRDLEDAGVVSDTWEWDLKGWDWTYLWACHAIVWGIAMYDVAAWNRSNPAGTSVSYLPLRNGTPEEAKTRSLASLDGAKQPVVYLEGVEKAVPLHRVQPVHDDVVPRRDTMTVEATGGVL